MKESNSEKGGSRQGDTQHRSVLTPEGQIEQARRFALGLKNMDSRRKKLLWTLLIVIFLPTLVVLVVSGIAWLVEHL